MTIPLVPLGPTTNVPLIGQGEPLFSSNAQISLTYQAQLPEDLNLSIEQMNILAQNLNDALTITEINNDSELFALPPNAPIKILGLRANPLVGALIDTAEIGSKRGAILHEPATGGVWFYSVPYTTPTGYAGSLIDLTATGSGGDFGNLGGYYEKVGTDASSVDAGPTGVNVVKQAIGSPVTIEFINLPTDLLASSRCYTCAFQITDGSGGNVLNFPPMTQYAGKLKPTLTLSGKDEFYLRTFGEQVADPDQGGAMVTQWYLSYIQDFGVPA